jgi:hypothetical protein
MTRNQPDYYILMAKIGSLNPSKAAGNCMNPCNLWLVLLFLKTNERLSGLRQCRAVYPKEDREMKWRMAVAVSVALCLGLVCSHPTLNNQAQAQGKAAPAAYKITVLSPMGTPPAIKLKPMAPRLDTLEGKTIYVVDQVIWARITFSKK